jgi:uncharacterized protein (TIGR02391 family)
MPRAMADLGEAMFPHSQNVTHAFSHAEVAIGLEPEELGAVLLELVHGGLRQGRRFSFLMFMDAINAVDTLPWPGQKRAAVASAIAEAMAWLERSGLIMPDYDQATGTGGTEFRMLTRKGQALRDRHQVRMYTEPSILPIGLVHASILERVHPAFRHGNYGVAVFSAFHAVEVAVRKAGKFDAEAIGVSLMREAFKPGTGRLANLDLPAAEQEAEAHLFAGAIGAAKNPTGHRDVEMNREEAARLILFASHLLAIVDARATKAGQGNSG